MLLVLAGILLSWIGAFLLLLVYTLYRKNIRMFREMLEISEKAGKSGAADLARKSLRNWEGRPRLYGLILLGLGLFSLLAGMGFRYFPR
jgi:hypothetical protein